MYKGLSITRPLPIKCILYFLEMLPSRRLVFVEGVVLIGRMMSKLAKTSHFIILSRVHIFLHVEIKFDTKCCCFKLV